jgi:hypothetical protein
MGGPITRLVIAGTLLHRESLLERRDFDSPAGCEIRWLCLDGLAEELRTPAGPSCVSGPWLRTRLVGDATVRTSSASA